MLLCKKKAITFIRKANIVLFWLRLKQLGHMWCESLIWIISVKDLLYISTFLYLDVKHRHKPLMVQGSVTWKHLRVQSIDVITSTRTQAEGWRFGFSLEIVSCVSTATVCCFICWCFFLCVEFSRCGWPRFLFSLHVQLCEPIATHDRDSSYTAHAHTPRPMSAVS